MFWWLLLAFVVGGIVGVTVMGMAAAAGRDSRERRQAGLEP